MRSSRAQSEVVGSILLVAIVVLAISVIGTLVLTGLFDKQDPVSADVQGQLTLNESGDYVVRFDHGGGDSIESSELRVVVRNESGAQEEVQFDGTAYSGDGNGRFDPGEQWENSSIVCTDSDCPVVISEGEPVQIILVHDATNTVLFNGERTVE